MQSLIFFVCLISTHNLCTANPIVKDDESWEKDVFYQLYNRENSGGKRIVLGDESSLTDAGFNPSLSTKIIFHGWMDSSYGGGTQRIKSAFLDLEPLNVILVDWSSCSKSILYDKAVECSKRAGEMGGELILWLNATTGISIQQFHGLGSSLGGQAVAFISRKVLLPRISGIDPAGPLYSYADPENRLDSTDAEFVDVIHASTGFYGSKTPFGHADFYPNGGTGQPGCNDALGGCSHGASVSYYVYTIPEAHRDYFLAYRCENVESALNQNCTLKPQARMGYGASPDFDGIYYIKVDHIP